MQRVHSRRSEGSEAEVDGLGTRIIIVYLFFNIFLLQLSDKTEKEKESHMDNL